MKRLVPLLLAMLAPFLISMGKKKEYTVTFHAEAESNDMPKTMFPFQLEGQQRVFKVIPEVSQSNVVAFHPFPSETGVGNGVTLQLDFRGRSALELATRTRQGQYFLAMVNGTPVDYVVLDQVVRDGMITIWQGVPDEVVALMDKQLTRIRPGHTPSMSDNMEMVPTTRKEKKRLLKQEREAQKEAAKREASGEINPYTEDAPTIQSLPNIPSPTFDPAAPVMPVQPVEPIAPLPGS